MAHHSSFGKSPGLRATCRYFGQNLGVNSHDFLLYCAVMLVLKHHFVNVAPAPIFAWLKGLDNGMLGRVEMFGSMLVL
jgi:hypothetical protein